MIRHTQHLLALLLATSCASPPPPMTPEQSRANQADLPQRIIALALAQRAAPTPARAAEIEANYLRLLDTYPCEIGVELRVTPELHDPILDALARSTPRTNVRVIPTTTAPHLTISLSGFESRDPSYYLRGVAIKTHRMMHIFGRREASGFIRIRGEQQGEPRDVAEKIARRVPLELYCHRQTYDRLSRTPEAALALALIVPYRVFVPRWPSPYMGLDSEPEDRKVRSSDLGLDSATPTVSDHTLEHITGLRSANALILSFVRSPDTAWTR